MKYAYVTLATTESFLRGARLLGYSLKRVQSKYPLVIMITENLQHLIDEKDGHIYKIIPHYSFRNGDRYKDTINKLQVFDLLEYDKTLFLDSDRYVFQNIDDVFEIYPQEFYASIRLGDGYKNVSGDLFLSTPTKNKFNEILNNDRYMGCFDDESILDDIYRDFVNSHPVEEMIHHNRMVHISTPIKYWEIKSVSISELDTMTNDEIEVYLKDINQGLRIDLGIEKG